MEEKASKNPEGSKKKKKEKKPKKAAKESDDKDVLVDSGLGSPVTSVTENGHGLGETMEIDFGQPEGKTKKKDKKKDKSAEKAKKSKEKSSKKDKKMKNGDGTDKSFVDSDEKNPVSNGVNGNENLSDQQSEEETLTEEQKKGCLSHFRVSPPTLLKLKGIPVSLMEFRSCTVILYFVTKHIYLHIQYSFQIWYRGTCMVY